MAAGSTCARVSIEIVQELTLERAAFDAKMVIHNNLPDTPLENIRVDVTIKNEEGNLRNDLFFQRVSSKSNIDTVDGAGTIPANTTAEVHWLIIPSPGAGGEAAAGIPYFVGATLTYTLDGEQQLLPIDPDKITVRPAPQLYLDYFMPRSVLGDNPFTPQTEAPVPYPLAVRVLNDGFGAAGKLKIDSAQPRIVDNEKGLLIGFRLLGAAVNDGAVLPSLTVDMGDLPSKQAATAWWEMISTLSGRFVDFNVSFTHAAELGGELTSLIKETNAHYLVHRVKVNLPGRDARLDYLADTNRDNEHLPDAIFESEIPAGGSDRNAAKSLVTVISPVSSPARPTPEEPAVNVTLDLTGNPLGWVYTRMADPSQGLLRLAEVIRADGVRLDPNNFWVDEGLDTDYQRTDTLQFIDYRADSSAPGTYTLVFAQPAEDLAPPETTLVYDGPAVLGETVYLTPQTRTILTARDNDGGSGVEQMFKKIAGQDIGFVPAYPFRLAAGSHDLEFYSVDRAGNVEGVKSARMVVDDAPPLVQSFAAQPAVFSPQAPQGVVAARALELVLTATDTVAALPVKIEIFSAGGEVVRSLSGVAQSGTELRLAWDGRDQKGRGVADGVYTARLTVSDGLDNPYDPEAPAHSATAEATVTAAGWFDGTPVDPFPGAAQMYPAVSGTRVVWQDNRHGNWDVYLKDLAGGAAVRLTTDAVDQELPAIGGSLVVWQDRRNGDWDIYGYDLGSSAAFAVFEGPGDQQNPVISGEWVAWQDRRSGNWDIFAKNLTTGEIRQITSHERDQMRPALSGTTLAWEDYRHGLGEIYRVDLSGGAETRVTSDVANQFLPAVSGATIVWTDQRDGQQEIYRHESNSAERLTYGTGDRSQAALGGNLLVYTDFEAGTADPNLAYLNLNGAGGARLTTHPARQEEPAIDGAQVVWQDDRGGTWQIYRAELATVDQPVEVQLHPGFNLVAVGGRLADSYITATGLMAASSEPVIDRALSYSAPHGRFFEADQAGGDFAMVRGGGLVLYARQAGTLQVADAGETMSYTLLPGTNHIGMLSVPYGYRAHDLLRSVGLEQIQSVRRFDGESGLWQSAAVRDNGGTLEIVGSNFAIKAGDGLVITMKDRVDGWQP